MTQRAAPTPGRLDLLATIRRAARQEQFLEVVSAEEAQARFARHVAFDPLPAETVALAASLGRVLAHDVMAPIDVPPFDRSNVDGFALRAADSAGASDAAPVRLRLNAEVIVCGHSPVLEVAPGCATTIATGGVLPRGADAVAMVEHTDLVDHAAPAIDLRRTVAPGQLISYAGSDIARGEVVLRRGTRIGSREIGMLAACGIAAVAVVGKPNVAVLSTGDELVAPGEALKPAGVYDSNGAIIAAAVTEAGGVPILLGAVADDEAALERAIRDALARCDLVLLSGGTSKGAGDLSHQVVSRLGSPASWCTGLRSSPANRCAWRWWPASPWWCCRAFRPRRSSPSTPSWPRSSGRAPGCRPRRPARWKRKCRCASPPSSAARNSCWWRWWPGSMVRSRFRFPKARAPSPASRKPTDS